MGENASIAYTKLELEYYSLNSNTGREVTYPYEGEISCVLIDDFSEL